VLHRDIDEIKSCTRPPPFGATKADGTPSKGKASISLIRAMEFSPC
jgi:hypothetical protein